MALAAPKKNNNKYCRVLILIVSLETKIPNFHVFVFHVFSFSLIDYKYILQAFFRFHFALQVN